MIDLGCEHCEQDEFGGFYCNIECRMFRKCEKCHFNTRLIEAGLEKRR